jgi:hypothetical protein
MKVGVTELGIWGRYRVWYQSNYEKLDNPLHKNIGSLIKKVNKEI